MRAKFAGGPYDLCVLEVKQDLTHVRLPISVEATADPRSKVWNGHALYTFRHGNEYERVYYVDRLEM